MENSIGFAYYPISSINTELLDMNKKKKHPNEKMGKEYACVIHRRERQMENSYKEEDMKAPI